MGFKKKVNFNKLGNNLEKSRVKKLRLLSSEIIVGVIKRTQRGKDVKNKTFKKYTKKYGEMKAKKYGVRTPNLTNTGDMLNSISSKNINKGIRLYFISSDENAKAVGNNKKRNFFGTDPKQQKEIKRKLQRK